ncbi:hypothetical protein IAT38_006814 [Cryptococcus sp. DSM 104549]
MSATPSGSAIPSQPPSPPPMSHRSSTPHPLSTPRVSSVPFSTRPALAHATSETERQVAESSRSGGSERGGSMRGSLDLLRMSSVEEEKGAEVEVLIHTIKQGESLAGIALLYGIDLPTLRKVNKLWASDPIHIRTHLYVPLDACRWNKAKESLVRGPGEGQVTLLPKERSREKTEGKGKEVNREELEGREDKGRGVWESDIWAREGGVNGDPAQTFMPSTNAAYERPTLRSQPPALPNSSSLSSSPDGSLPNDDAESTPRVLDVVRIPSSRLRFFPRANPPDPPSRASLDRTSTKLPRPTRSSVDIPSNGPSIIPDLATLPAPLRPPHTGTLASPPRKSKSMVRLRPPQQTPPLQTGSALANRLSSLFTVPPPPANISPLSPLSGGPLSASAAGMGNGIPRGTSPARGRLSMDSVGGGGTRSGRSTPRRVSSATAAAKEDGEREEMELVTRIRDGVGLGIGLGRQGSTGAGAKGKKQD